jgi:hypothetical protein
MAAPNITLFRGFLDRGCYVVLPFVNKLEARLRIGRICYRVGCGSVFKAPPGKIPTWRSTAPIPELEMLAQIRQLHTWRN